MACPSGQCPTQSPPSKPPKESCCTVRDIDRTAIMMCMTCPHARASKFHFCTLNGQLTAKRACDRSGIMATAAVRVGCPIGRQPDAKGRVRWLDETWLGVPFPLRLLLKWPFRLWWGTPKLTRDLEGCGCQREMRVVWEAYKRRLRIVFGPTP